MQKISVIIPVYNSKNFLESCIKSVLEQTYTNLEIILIDDGSNDGSGEICDRIAENDERIKVVHQKNSGVSCARNRGMELMTGDLISFVDSDDQLEKDMYSFLVKLITDFDADISHCGYKRVDKNNNIIKEVSGTHELLQHTGKEAIKCMLDGKYFVGGLWNKLYKTEIINNLSFCEELKNNEDILFNVKAFASARKIVFADETKYRYFEHSDSACNQINKYKQLCDCFMASEMMLEIEDSAIKEIVKKRMYNCSLSLYRFLIMNPRIVPEVDRKKEKQLFIDCYKKLTTPTRRESFNYYMLICLPQIYKILYGIYDLIRKPNWDAKIDSEESKKG